MKFLFLRIQKLRDTQKVRNHRLEKGVSKYIIGKYKTDYKFRPSSCQNIVRTYSSTYMFTCRHHTHKKHHYHRHMNMFANSLNKTKNKPSNKHIQSYHTQLPCVLYKLHTNPSPLLSCKKREPMKVTIRPTSY